MDNYLYSTDHEWVLQQDGRAKVGISEFAQSELGDISFVELPEVGRQVNRGEAVCSIDSLKSTSEIYAPVSGTILEVNNTLADEQACATINSDPLGQGWLFVIQMNDPKEIEELLTRSEYEHYLESG
ncbi:Glycine cleavage system H protein [subsurface metagenome]